MAEPLEGTERAANMLKRVHYTHDAMVDYILRNPEVPQNTMALYFGFSVPWVSTIVNSDAFQARLAQRKTELVDPAIVQDLEDRFKVMANQSLNIIQEKLAASKNVDVALKALDLSTKALGMGARIDKTPAMQQTFVVMMPPKAESQEAWAKSAREAIDVTSRPVTTPQE